MDEDDFHEETLRIVRQLRIDFERRMFAHPPIPGDFSTIFIEPEFRGAVDFLRNNKLARAWPRHLSAFTHDTVMTAAFYATGKLLSNKRRKRGRQNVRAMKMLRKDYLRTVKKAMALTPNKRWFLHDLASFPSSRHDDIVDSIVIGLQWGPEW